MRVCRAQECVEAEEAGDAVAAGLLWRAHARAQSEAQGRPGPFPRGLGSPSWPRRGGGGNPGPFPRLGTPFVREGPGGQQRRLDNLVGSQAHCLTALRGHDPAACPLGRSPDAPNPDPRSGNP